MSGHPIRPCLAAVVLALVIVFHGVAGAQSWSSLPTIGSGPIADGGAYPAVAFDRATGRAIAFGGIPHTGNVWILDHADGLGGTPAWQQLAPAGAAPPARHAHGQSYDPASNRLIVFGGCAGGCFPTLNDVWVLTNANGMGGTPEWINLSPPGGPAGRAHPGVAYDDVTNRLIVFGGQDGGGFGGSTFPEVWILTNANGLGGAASWQKLAPVGGPPPGQYGPTVSYDPSTNRLTAFAGAAQGTGALTNAVWVLDHANGAGGTPVWSNLIPEGAAGSPSPNAFVRGARDDAHNRLRVVGFGADYVWTLDGANGAGGVPVWTQTVADGMPPPTPIGLVALNAASDRLTVVGPSAFAGGAVTLWLLAEANQQPVADAGADRTVEATSVAGACVTLDGTASSDADGDALTFEWSGPFGTLTGPTIDPQLPMGSWIIWLTVEDGRGGISMDAVVVNVIDSTPPAVTLTLSVDTLWSPNNKMVPVTITADVTDQAGAAACAITSVSSNEPPPPDSVDWEVTGPLNVSLRASRDGSGAGRTYSIVVDCTDAAGNRTASAVPVFVPHDRR